MISRWDIKTRYHCGCLVFCIDYLCVKKEENLSVFTHTLCGKGYQKKKIFTEENIRSARHGYWIHPKYL